MTIQTVGYTRKPFHVDAVLVTKENIEEVAAWCKGTIKESTKSIRDDDNKIIERIKTNFIKVEVHRPLNDRQTKAYPGDWILLSDAGFKVYTEKAFGNAFEKEPAHTDHEALEALKGAVDKPVTAKLGSKKVKISEVFDDGRSRFPEPTVVYTEEDAAAQLVDLDELEEAMTR